MLHRSQSKFFRLWKGLSNRKPISHVGMISLGLVVEPLLRFRLAHLRAGEQNVALTAVDTAYDYGLATLSCILFYSTLIGRVGERELNSYGHLTTRLSIVGKCELNSTEG